MNRPDEAAMTKEVEGALRGESRRERNKREKLGRIREAAWELFRERGFEGTTTRGIAERADVGAGTLFLYARDKGELLLLLYDGALAREAEEALDALSDDGGPLLDELVYVFGRLLGVLGRDRELSRLYVKELLSGGDSPVRRGSLLALEGFLGRLAGRVELARERGEVADDADAAQAARNLFWIYYGEVTAWLARVDGEGGIPEAPLRRALELQVRGLLRSRDERGQGSGKVER